MGLDGNATKNGFHPGQGGIGVVEGQFTLGGHDLKLDIHIGQMTRVDAGQTEGRSGTGRRRGVESILST